ncbi:SPOR domain-containing protein [Bradyrhizobium sp.]|uniref:SPOR domain-containing protein n=1 Tax=Bradyrhizobium sp. TaxID=376 RepID=UPI001DA0B43D|nr:SPOR domain-containing protein [Bradyrhizobium sp.]MBI5319738.1 SPOR domain-containing protein [Bradyrhizobium sp.]
MADRYQDRPFPAHDDYGRGADQHGQKAESDPLAELARLIGQTDPFAMGRANVKAQPQAAQRYQAPQYETPQYQPEQYQPEQYEPEQYEPEPEPPAGPPPWMQRANARSQQPAPPPPPQYDDEADYQPAPVHPLHRYGAQQAAPPPQQHAQYQYQDEPQYAEQAQPDPSRYDDALYGQIEAGQDYQRDPAYPDDPYAYQGAYDEEPEEPPRKRGGMITVAAVLALAVVGTGAAFAYRNFIGSPRSGEPPIIKADNSPTKVVPAQSDTAPKSPDRMTFGDGKEKIVPREETPVDVNARSGPRVVFPPLNQNANPPSPASVTPNTPPPPTAAANGTLANSEPRRIKTLSVKGDAADAGLPAGSPPRPGAPPAQVAAPRTQAPAAPPPAAAPRNPPTSANASANAPLSLTPGAPAAAEPPARVAAVNPAPAPAPAAGGGYVVQVSSQKTEADAQASYRSLQGKFPNVLGSRPPLIKRADLGEKGVFYRAMVGPFGTRDEAAQFCSNLKTAGGQCVIQSN